MLIRRTVLAGTTDSFPINGRYFSLIQGSNCRVNLLSNNARVFSSEVYEGMGTKLDVVITHVEIESKIEQVVEYWLGESEYQYTPPASRPQNLRAGEVAVVSGITRVVTANQKNTGVKITVDKDCWIGGDDMAINESGDGVTNAIRLKEGRIFETSASGSLNVFLTHRSERDFAALSTVDFGLSSRPSYERTISNILAEDVGYIDVEIPDHLVGVPLDYEWTWGAPNLSSWSDRVNYSLAIYQSNVDGAPDELLTGFGGVSAGFGHLNPPFKVGGRSRGSASLKHKRTRLWFVTSRTGAKLGSLTLSHPNWSQIRGTASVLVESL